MSQLGYYSQQAVDYGCGSVIYRTPDGKEVEVTTVCSSPSLYNWSDKRLVSEVTTYVRQGRPRAQHMQLTWSRR